MVLGRAAGLALVRVLACSVAEVEPSRERGVWAEALAVPSAKAARMRMFFIEIECGKAMEYNNNCLSYGIVASVVDK
jgi:hypothetical protein